MPMGSSVAALNYAYGQSTIISSDVCMLQIGEAKCVRTALYRVAVIFFLHGIFILNGFNGYR